MARLHEGRVCIVTGAEGPNRPGLTI